MAGAERSQSVSAISEGPQLSHGSGDVLSEPRFLQLIISSDVAKCFSTHGRRGEPAHHPANLMLCDQIMPLLFPHAPWVQPPKSPM